MELSERPPYAPGTSPFKAKGTSYIGHVDWVSEKFPGGRDAYLNLLAHDPALREFHAQKFLAPVWYDFMPLVCVGYTCAKAMGMEFEEFIIYRARYQAEHDMRGVYKVVLAMTPNALLARKLTAIMAQYFDFGEPVVRGEKKGFVHCELLALPTMFVPWMRACLSGFIEVVLKTGGARNVRVNTTSTPSGEAKGHPASVLGIEINWT